MKRYQILLKSGVIILLLTIRFNTSAQAPFPKTGNDTTCAGSTKSYGIIDVPASTYQWSVLQGLSGTDWLITTTGHNTISVKWINPGNYGLHVKETNSAGCDSTVSINVVVNSLQASIVYAGTPYCTVGTAVVTQNGQTGGTYSSTAGLIIDSVTGTINLSASTPGVYTVTYSFSNGACANSVSTTITINPKPSTTPITHN